MGEFSRAFRLFEKVFPPSGANPYEFPHEVSPGVQLTFDPFGRLLTQGAQLRSSFNANALGAGSTTVALPEPQAGFIQFPVSLLVQNPDAAVRLIILNTGTSGNPQDPWGQWGSGAGNGRIDSIIANFGEMVPFNAIPIPRGTRLEVTWTGMTGGNNADVHFFWVEIPGELVSLEQILVGAIRGNRYVHNRPV